MFCNKDEKLSQYRELGVPSDAELQSSKNVVYVHAYTRDDGTEVKSHYRGKPDGIMTNNLATENKIQEDGTLTGGASENSTEYTDYTIGEPIVDVSTPEKVQKLMYPDEIAGVEQNVPKTFEQMMQQGVNPKYLSEEDEKGEYSNNCACCTVAGELVQRGYDVEAGPADNQIAKELSKADKSAYLDPATGKECIPEEIDIDEVDCFSYIDKKVKQGERYEFSYYTQRNLFYGEDNENAYNNQKTQGHIVLITRNGKNDLVWYDPQDGDRHEGAVDVKAFLNSWVNERTLFAPRILRVDDKALNPKYVNSVVRKRKN